MATFRSYTREPAATFLAHRFHDAFEEVGAPLRYQLGCGWDDAPDEYRKVLERVMARLVADGVVEMGEAWAEHLARTQRRVYPRQLTDVDQ